MSTFLGRYRRTNEKDTLKVQRRVINLLTFIPYLLHKIFRGFISILVDNVKDTDPEWIWVDWTDLRNILDQMDEELNIQARDMDKKVKERKTIEDWIKGEIKSLDGDENVNRGYSKPFRIDSLKLIPIGLNFVRPKQDWKKTLNPKLFGGTRKTASGREIDPGKQKMPGDFSTNYTLKDFEHHSVSMNAASEEMGADSLVYYKEEDKKKKGKGKNKGNNGFNPKNRKKQEQHGESPEGHQERLDAIHDGEDVSDWEPH